MLIFTGFYSVVPRNGHLLPGFPWFWLSFLRQSTVFQVLSSVETETDLDTGPVRSFQRTRSRRFEQRPVEEGGRGCGRPALLLRKKENKTTLSTVGPMKTFDFKNKRGNYRVPRGRGSGREGGGARRLERGRLNALAPRAQLLQFQFLELDFRAARLQLLRQSRLSSSVDRFQNASV